MTTTGPVRGRQDARSGLCTFLGIPYASAPVGERRFQAPQPVTPWTEVCEAVSFGPAAAQYFDPQEVRLEEIEDAPASLPVPPYVGSEDCLTLNVWTPGVHGRRPVIVWIHGGANWLESSRLPMYHGERLAQHGDVVFVSLNYRLGLFGFVDLSVIGGDAFRGTHSNGLRDQLLALEWIKGNAAAFGGDPDNITLMGESAGSMDASWLMTTGRLQGLVRRVALMSGIAGVPGFGSTSTSSAYSEAAGQDAAIELLNLLDIRRMEQMLAMSTDEIMRRFATVVPRRHMLFHWDSLFYPRVDGEFTRCTPFECVRAGAARHFDVMLGSTGYEMGLWLLWDPTLDRRSPRWMAEALVHFPEHLRDSIAVLYDRAYPEEAPGVRGMHLMGDAMFVMPAVLFAEEHARTGGRTWMYQFTWEVPNSAMRATHAADVPFFFDHCDLPAAYDLIGVPDDPAQASQRRLLAARMRDALLSFARSGDPNTGRSELPPWPRYDQRSRAVMTLNFESSVKHDPFQARRTWWQENVYEPAFPR